METAADIDYIFSGLPIAFFNVAVLTAPQMTGAQLQAHADSARRWAVPAGVPWLLVVTHDTLAAGVDANADLAACGFIPMLPLTGMFADRVNAPARIPEALGVGMASDDASCVAALDINAAAYVADMEASKPIYGRRTVWDEHVLALGRAAGTPVASAAVMHVDGHRYVALVATLPGHQRRGYAEAVMRYALDVSAARFGDRPTTLHATEAGRPIYERMGYRTIARHTAYIDQALMHAS